MCAATAAEPAPPKAGPAAEAGKPSVATLKPLSKEQQDKLLVARLDGGLGQTFHDFANVFLVVSRVKLPSGAGLMTSSPEIAQTQLHPVFPTFYKPTLRELLDVLALETSSEWKYDPTSKYFQSDAETGPVEGLAVFEFTKIKRKKSFEVTLAKGWKATDKGNWLMLVPAMFPLGMDIHELGSYSSDDKAKEKDLLAKVPIEMSLEWARRRKTRSSGRISSRRKSARYDALYFETMMVMRDGSTIHWRRMDFHGRQQVLLCDQHYPSAVRGPHLSRRPGHAGVVQDQVSRSVLTRRVFCQFLLCWGLAAGWLPAAEPYNAALRRRNRMPPWRRATTRTPTRASAAWFSIAGTIRRLPPMISPPPPSAFGVSAAATKLTFSWKMPSSRIRETGSSFGMPRRNTGRQTIAARS